MKLPCYLVRDLLPLYKDELCEPETASDLREHLDGCPDCRALWEKMQADDPLEGAAAEARGREEADALRRVRKNQRKKRLLTVVATVLAVLMLCAGGLIVYDHANSTYLDYPQESILGVEEESLSSEWRIKGKGIVLKLDSAEMASLYWTQVVDTIDGDALVFTLGRSKWHIWTHAQWTDDAEDGSHELLLYTEALNGREAMERLKAVYYLPYAEFEDWYNAAVQDVPEDAVLVWQRDAE